MSIETLRANLNEGGHRFLGWWGATLLDCVPRRLRDLGSRRGPAILLRLGRGAATLDRARGGRERRLGEFAFDPADPQGAREAARALLPRARGGGGAVRLLLRPGSVLATTIELPAAAAENLREVIGFEMDRHSPFAAKDVWFDHRVSPAGARDGRIRADLAIAPRSVVEEAREACAAWGIAVASIGAADLPWANLADGAAPLPARGDGRWFTGVLALVAAALLAATVLVPLHEARQRLAALEERASAMRAQAVATDRIKQDIQERLGRSTALVDRRAAAPGALEVVAGITDLLPDDTWLVHLDLRDGRVTMTGYSAAAAELVAPLENSGLFSRVAFNGPVTPEPTLSLDRFTITATVDARAKPSE